MPSESELKGDGLCPKCGKGAAHPELGGCDCLKPLKREPAKPTCCCAYARTNDKAACPIHGLMILTAAEERMWRARGCPPPESEANLAYAALEIIREARERYPEDQFPEPPPGEHGETVDACSARAYRTCLKSVYNEICKRLNLHPYLREGAHA